MKKFLLLVCALLAVALPMTLRAADQDFTLINKTGFDIHSVFVSPHGTEDWEEDVLGRAVLINGDHVDIKFSRDDKAKRWDLKVTDKDGKGYIWENINLFEVAKITVEYKNGNASATYE